MNERQDHHVLTERIDQLESRVRALETENQRLRDLAFVDELTHLGNRRSFRAQLDHSVEVARRYGGRVSVLVADLDGLKELNDESGHPAGDEALRRIGRIFSSSVRGADVAARLGGDEFAVVMPATSAADAARVAHRIRAQIEALLLPGGKKVTASFGVATVDSRKGHGFAADDLFARADAALYQAKRQGKNRVHIDAESNDRAA